MSDRAMEVLVVDDDDGIREVLRCMLEDEGYTVYEASDGVRGLNCLRTHPTPLVVLLDWRMPGMDGLQMLQALAADTPVAKHHAFILLTTLYNAPELSTCHFPADISVSVMAKPFDMYALWDAVAAAAEQAVCQHGPVQSIDDG